MSLECLQVDLACTVIRLSQASLDGSPLVDQVEPILGQNRFLVLDAGGINFTSMEIGELVNLADDFYKSWEGKARHIAMINLTPSAETTFSITKLDKIFPNFSSVSAALDHFQSGEPPELKAAQ